ncbi:MAG: cyanobactin biosynthesis system PatB/AcyB/McaB family protein [Nostoc sp. DedQUE01]|uniref:cyanobactin biosynthesis system PatB/AcyB/McaB family protein n=1 Tax=Nostoc sp. CCY 9925 TaxID=3103865 RepID=UPI002ADBF352|nr:cyanobactin biosynthesis system PatB/AcyB/McaB family protein [Nostoc sp. DedQUE11]MDZ8072446.1 cyanobactin biosynthesis system PatB/AcyB/McaB family protein [Nostoc sp. DedQUE01]
MRLPVLSPPVKRPHFVQPALCVDLENGDPEDLVHIRMDLLHAANYNDPSTFANRNINQVMHSCASPSWGGFAGMGRFF